MSIFFRILRPTKMINKLGFYFRIPETERAVKFCQTVPFDTLRERRTLNVSKHGN